MRRQPGNAEIRQLCVRAREGSAGAREQVLSIHMGLIVRAARCFYRAGAFMELGDLIQQGCLGLLHAIEKFDPDRRSRGKKVRFSTYAYYWIQHSIRREIENHGLTIAVPIQRLRDLKSPGSREHSRCLPSAYSLEPGADTWLEDAQGVAWARIVDLNETPDRWCEVWEYRQCVERLLAGLPRQQQDILRSRFGLDGSFQGKTQKQTGEAFRISGSRVGLLERTALNQLRRTHPRDL